MTQPKKPNPRLTRLILSHFSTLLFFIRSLPSRPAAGQDEEAGDAGGMLFMALSESAKLVPWVLGARKHIRAYVKVSQAASKSSLLADPNHWRACEG